MPDQEMIERVAKAIHDRSLDDDQLADFGLPMNDAITMATAAIKAMREPTEKMISAGMDGDSLEVGSSAYGCWQDMIDSILND